MIFKGWFWGFFLHKSTCCGYSLELPCQGDSDEHPQHTLFGELMKIILQLSSNTHLISSTDTMQSADYRSSGCEFKPQPSLITYVEIYHETISLPILPVPLIQEGQLSVTGKKMCTKDLRLKSAQEQCE